MAGGIGDAHCHRPGKRAGTCHLPRPVPAAVASRASPAAVILSGQGGKKGEGLGKILAGPGRPPARLMKQQMQTSSVRGTRFITEFFKLEDISTRLGRRQHCHSQQLLPRHHLLRIPPYQLLLQPGRAHHSFHVSRFFCTALHHSFCCHRCLGRRSGTAHGLATCSVIRPSCLGCVCVWKG